MDKKIYDILKGIFFILIVIMLILATSVNFKLSEISNNQERIDVKLSIIIDQINEDENTNN